MLSQEQIDLYHANGYVGVEGVISAREVSELQRVTDEFVERSREVTEHTDVFDLEPGHSRDHPKLRRLKRPIVQHEIYRDLLHHEDILTMVSQLIGHGLRCNGDKLNLKLPEFGSPVEWHQDWAFYPHTNQDVLAVGILLDDMNPDNGPLMVLPGSHRGPVYDHHSYGAFCGAIDVDRESLDVSGAREVHGRAGSITIHHVRLVHGSGMNRSDRQRRVLFFEYAAADAWPLAGIENLNDLDDFNGRMVHGEPTLRPRLEDVPVKMPLPRAPYQGSIYENQRTLSAQYFDHADGATQRMEHPP